MPEFGEWDGLFEGIDVTGMRWAWLSGLSGHPAPDVRVRLAPLLFSMAMDEGQPPEVVDAAVASPDWRVRRYWAEYQRGMTLAQWVRLLDFDGPDWQQRALRHFARRNAPRPPAQWFARRAADPDPRVRLRTLWFRGLPGEVAVALAADPDSGVRAEVCGCAWEHLGAEQRAVLATDPDPGVREAAQGQVESERPLSPAEFEELDENGRIKAVHLREVEEELARHLVDHPDPKLRRFLAGRPLPPDVLAALAADPDEDVRAEIVARPDTPEELRARACTGLPPNKPSWDLRWVEELHGDPEAMRRLAASASAAVRRSVARARTLPPDVLARLAHDPVSSVRTAITAHNEAAPPELLLEAARTWNYPGSVLHHPHFPFDRLRAAWADDPEPTVRRLALYAPDCTPELVERLAEDPDERVHQRAAADPRLSPATVLRLLDATEADYRATLETPGLPVPHTYELRRAVIRNPRLPVPVLIGLLRDREQAQAAAANPAVPAAVAHRLVDLVADRKD
ncbi:hypothetical protein Kpho02_38580 [Kitasatospora phosalacinea]|uniref:Uncharacterized protein n=1 Tax=Kitasatospora phosalacinea TaxID=2065 RepID=A0A9W6QAJ9_9ACTN|nr:PE-PGRS family protein [Kitasatospora phosalacinea]GLW71559.1 hypothetical protein Kpho02_38580 [Kitasatospora phosalacinea]